MSIYVNLCVSISTFKRLTEFAPPMGGPKDPCEFGRFRGLDLTSPETCTSGDSQDSPVSDGLAWKDPMVLDAFNETEDLQGKLMNSKTKIHQTFFLIFLGQFCLMLF